MVYYRLMGIKEKWQDFRKNNKTSSRQTLLNSEAINQEIAATARKSLFAMYQTSDELLTKLAESFGQTNAEYPESGAVGREITRQGENIALQSFDRMLVDHRQSMLTHIPENDRKYVALTVLHSSRKY